MINKLAIVAVALVTSMVPAFAQSFCAFYGTGNVLPSYFDRYGALHQGKETPSGSGFFDSALPMSPQSRSDSREPTLRFPSAIASQSRT